MIELLVDVFIGLCCLCFVLLWLLCLFGGVCWVGVVVSFDGVVVKVYDGLVVVLVVLVVFVGMLVVLLLVVGGVVVVVFCVGCGGWCLGKLFVLFDEV